MQVLRRLCTSIVRRMPRNVEVKARVTDPESLDKRIFDLADSLGFVSKQEDVFFKVPSGRLKLRIIDANPNGELIFYERPDHEGPKTSHYSKSPISDAQQLKETLGEALGIVGYVRKTRRLHMLGQTRIHVDEVERLGHFMELEVVLEPTQTSEDGQKIAEDIMEKLDIDKKNLIAGAYMDLLLDQTN